MTRAERLLFLASLCVSAFVVSVFVGSFFRGVLEGYLAATRPAPRVELIKFVDPAPLPGNPPERPQ